MKKSVESSRIVVVTKTIIYILEVIVMDPLERAFGVIVVALITIFGISGMAVIGILGKIIEWFA